MKDERIEMQSLQQLNPAKPTQNVHKFVPELWRPELYLAVTSRNIIEFGKVILLISLKLKYLDPKVIVDLVTIIIELYDSIQITGSKFIKECLLCIEDRLKVDVINCIAELINPELMAAVLVYPDIPVDRRSRNLKTPLLILTTKLTTNNFNRTFECIKILLSYGANPNLGDDKNYTPIYHVIVNKILNDSEKEIIVNYFLNHSEIDFDDTILTLINNGFPGIQTPLKSLSVLKFATLTKLSEEFHTMILSLENSREDEFLQQFNKLIPETIHPYNAYDQYLELLILTIKNGLHKSFDTIIKTGLNFNFRCNGETPIKIACLYGNKKALQKLLDQETFKLRNTDNLLISAIEILDEHTNRECLYALIDSKKIDVNDSDSKGYSALHYAAMSNRINVVQKLLKRGAYIGARNIYNELAISKIHPDILKECFDSYINSNALIHESKSNNFSIKLNYVNLIPTKMEEQSIIKPTTETTSLLYIAESKQLRHLLQHPLITSFLYIKWINLSKIFYCNFIVCLVLWATLVSLLIIKFMNTSTNEGHPKLLLVVLSTCVLYMILREILQLFMGLWTFLKDIVNYLEIMLIILIINIIFGLNYDIETQKFVAIFTTILTVLELYFTVNSVPFEPISLYMLMFQKVFKTFIKSLLVFSIFILTFTACFIILFSKHEPTKLNKVENNVIKNCTEDKKNNDFNEFSNPYIAFIKTMVMMTGELDAGEINFNSLWSYLLFLLFLLLITITLFNLLNGLAVGNATDIKRQAELYDNITRTLSKYDTIFMGNMRTKSIKLLKFPSKQIQYVKQNFSEFYQRNYMLLTDKTIRCHLQIESHSESKTLITYWKNSQSIIEITRAPLINKNRLSHLKIIEKLYYYIILVGIKFDKEVIKQSLSIIDKKEETKYFIIEKTYNKLEGFSL